MISVPLPDDKVADLGIINIFEPGDGDTVTSSADGFSHSNARINGKERDFAEYCREIGLDVRLPLVATYCGAKINVSFQAIGEDKVDFYAPVFKDVEYRQARAVEDYVGAFTGDLLGPFTFGEVAYQLLNQTLVYLTIEDSA